MGRSTILIATFLCIGEASAQILDIDRMSKDDLPEQVGKVADNDHFADLDREVIELGRAIALNPEDANAFLQTRPVLWLKM